MNARSVAVAAILTGMTLLGVAYGNEEPVDARRLSFTTTHRSALSKLASPTEKLIETAADYFALFDGRPPYPKLDFKRQRAAIVAAGAQNAQLEVTRLVRRVSDGKRPPVVEIQITEHPEPDFWGTPPVTRHVHVVAFDHVADASYVFVRLKADVGQFDKLVVEVTDPKLGRNVDTLTIAGGVLTHVHVDRRGEKTSRRPFGEADVATLSRLLAAAKLDELPETVYPEQVGDGKHCVLTLRRMRGKQVQVVRFVPFFSSERLDRIASHVRHLAWPLAGSDEEGEFTMKVARSGSLEDEDGNEYEPDGLVRYTLGEQKGKQLRIQGERSRGFWGIRGSVYVRAIVVKARTTRSFFKPKVEKGETLLVVSDYLDSNECVIRRPSAANEERGTIPWSDLVFQEEPRKATAGLIPGLPR